MSDNVINFPKIESVNIDKRETPQAAAFRHMDIYFNHLGELSFTKAIKLKHNELFYKVIKASKCINGSVDYTIKCPNGGTPLSINSQDKKIEVIVDDPAEFMRLMQEDRHSVFSCLYCKHLMKFNYATGYYHSYKCPVCQHILKDY